jgi:hypothetical protein
MGSAMTMKAASWLGGLCALLLLAALGGCAQTPDTGGGVMASAMGASASPARRPMPPAPPAADLVGMQAGEVEALLGPPSLLRRERDAQVWQYATDRCVLFLFLYPRNGGGHAVDHIEATPASGDDAAMTTAAMGRLLDGCVEAAMRAYYGRPAS